MNYPSVDIVTVSYREADCFQAFIKAVGKLDYPADKLKLIVVDNGSTDGALPLLKKLIPTLPFPGELIEAGENLGFGGGSNRGAFHGASDYILFLNPDAEIDGDALKILVERAEKEPLAGLVESAIYPHDVSKFCDSKTNYTDWCRGGILLARRDAFVSLGGFDTFFYPAYCEDVDLSWRMWLANWSCIKEPGAKIKIDNMPADGAIKPVETLFAVKYSFAMRFIYDSIPGFLSHIVRGFRYLISPKTKPTVRKGIIKGFIMLPLKFPALLKRRISMQKQMKNSTERDRFVFTEWYYGRWEN